MKLAIRIVYCCVGAIHINSVVILEIFECAWSDLIQIEEYAAEMAINWGDIVDRQD